VFPGPHAAVMMQLVSVVITLVPLTKNKTEKQKDFSLMTNKSMRLLHILFIMEQWTQPLWVLRSKYNR